MTQFCFLSLNKTRTIDLILNEIRLVVVYFVFFSYSNIRNIFSFGDCSITRSVCYLFPLRGNVLGKQVLT